MVEVQAEGVLGVLLPSSHPSDAGLLTLLLYPNPDPFLLPNLELKPLFPSSDFLGLLPTSLLSLPKPHHSQADPSPVSKVVLPRSVLLLPFYLFFHSHCNQAAPHLQGRAEYFHFCLLPICLFLCLYHPFLPTSPATFLLGLRKLVVAVVAVQGEGEVGEPFLVVGVLLLVVAHP